jgi:hypothetical protein
MPPSEGIPPLTFLLASNTSGGASREWLEPWPCMGASLVVPDSVTRGQLSNPGRGPAFDPSRFIVEISVCGSPSGPFEARIFRRRSEDGAVVGGVVRRLRRERRTRALTCGF